MRTVAVERTPASNTYGTGQDLRESVRRYYGPAAASGEPPNLHEGEIMRKRIACAFAAAAITLAGATVAGCSDNSDDTTTANTPTSVSETAEHTMSGVEATASAALTTARESAQDAINAAIAAAPIGFAPGTADLNPASDVTITAVATALTATDGAVQIEAYATNSDEDAATDLAERRADTVADALESKGIDRGRLSAEGTANPDNVNVDQVKITVSEN
ncbi:OmpA family protein (plasmid) [Rhodococcus opacus]|uniref:OmpA family protein n=1 Tax=Rhodococcus opacus TaxID=37919 RepID=UPI0034D15E1F